MALGLAAVAGVLVLAACGDSNDQDSAEPTATAEATSTPPELPTATSVPPTPPPTATPAPVPPIATYPMGTRTGDPAIDAIIEAIEQEDWDALAAMVVTSEYPCEARGNVQPQPLLCPDGMAVGELLRGLWVAHVEGGLWTFEGQALADRFELVLGEAPWMLYGVLTYPDGATAFRDVPLKTEVVFLQPESGYGSNFFMSIGTSGAGPAMIVWNSGYWPINSEQATPDRWLLAPR